MRTLDNYLQLLNSLFPKGLLWKIHPDSNLNKLNTGIAEEFVRIDERAETLVTTERDTRTTDELLTDFEKEYELPDECTELGVTIPQRRQELHTKATKRGRLDPGYFIEIANELGYNVSNIYQYRPFICGWGQSGDPCGGDNGYYWVMEIDNAHPFQCGLSVCGDPIGVDEGTNRLECIINKLKPAHTRVEFHYI